MCNSLKPFTFVLLAGLMGMLVSPPRSQAQTLGGDEVEGALKIECNNSGMRVYAYLDETWKQQTFSDNKSSMVHYEQGGTFKYSAGYYQGDSMTCTKNENISSTVNERIWTGGSVQLTMRTTYVSPSRTESYVFEVKNTSGSTINNVKLFHGQDTYLGYSDAGGGFWDNSRGVVGVKKPALDDPGREIYQTLGSASQRPDDYASAGYYEVSSLVAQGALNHTLDTNYFTDNGYAVQWNRSSLGPGETWTIAAGETMAVGAALTVEMAGDVEIGTETVMTGIVANVGESATVNVSAEVSRSNWTAAVSGSSSFTLDQGATTTILINVTCPAVSSVGQDATVTLTATDGQSPAEDSATATAVYYDGVALVRDVTDDGEPSIGEFTDFGGRLVGSVATQRFYLYNGGPSNITLLTNALTGSAQFSVTGLPASLDADRGTNFYVTFDVADYATETATLTLVDHKAWSPFVMNLQGYGFWISTNNGPMAGGGELIVTNGNLGSGADITQVTLGGRNAEIIDQGANWVRFIIPQQYYSGIKDISINSISQGSKTMRYCYYVNPPGVIDTVSPSVGSYTGGTQVTISGADLCNGDLSDITNVTLCGYAATDISINGKTQVICRTTAGEPSKGAVIIDSVSAGRAILYNAFSYEGPQFDLLGINGQVIANDAAPNYTNGTDFGYGVIGETYTRTFAITNSGSVVLNITGLATNGASADEFQVTACPSSVAGHTAEDLTVVYSPTSDVPKTASLVIYNDSLRNPFTINLAGDSIQFAPSAGPFAGNTRICLTNQALIDQVGLVTNVMIGGTNATLVRRTADSIHFLTPEAPRVGVVDVELQGTNDSYTLFDFYEYNPQPVITNKVKVYAGYPGMCNLFGDARVYYYDYYSQWAWECGEWSGGGVSIEMPVDFDYVRLYYYSSDSGYLDIGVTNRATPLYDGGTNLRFYSTSWALKNVYVSGQAGDYLHMAHATGGRVIFRYVEAVQSAYNMVDPASCTETGGVEVAIRGVYLCDGTVEDVTSVKLAGTEVDEVLSATPTQIIVRASAGPGGKGDVVVTSRTHGRSVAPGAFTYTGSAGFRLFLTNGNMLASGEAPSADFDTDFGAQEYGTARTNWITISNSSASAVSITGWTTNGSSAFRVASPWALPKSLAAGESANLPVVFNATEIGALSSTVTIANTMTGPLSSYELNLAASVYQFSTNAGSASGGNAVTLTNRVMGSGDDIYDVLCNGSSATIVDQGTDWVTFLMPGQFDPGLCTIEVRSFSEINELFADVYTYRERAWIGLPDKTAGTWHDVGGGLSGAPYATVYALTKDTNGAIYAGGEFKQSAYVDELNYVARWENGAWHQMDMGLDGFVHCLEFMNGTLYAGGAFLEDGRGTDMLRVAYWDGSEWREVGNGIGAPSSTVKDFLPVSGTLYAGIDVTSSSSTGKPLMVWSGGNWALQQGSAGNPDVWYPHVNALALYSNQVYAGGGFKYESAGLTNLMRWNGSTWEQTPDNGRPTGFAPWIKEGVIAMATNGNDLYVGGDFEEWSESDRVHGDYINGVVRYDGTSWTNPSLFADSLNVFYHDGERLIAGGDDLNYYNFNETNLVYLLPSGEWTNFTIYGESPRDYRIHSLVADDHGLYVGFYVIGIKYLCWDLTNGLSPQSGAYTGGYTVRINGVNLGNGNASDVYKVTLCGTEVSSIDSVSSTQIVVTAGRGTPGIGDVVVYTHDYGAIIQSNVFTYTGGAGLRVYGEDGAELANNAAASESVGTLQTVGIGNARTGTLMVANPGDSLMTVSTIITNAAPGLFEMTISDRFFSGGETNPCMIRFNPDAVGTSTGSFRIISNAKGPASNFVINVEASAYSISPASGPWSGGGTLAITNNGLGNGSDISSVTIGGYVATITGQGTDWVTVTLPTVTNGGAMDIVIDSDSVGETVLPEAYTYHLGSVSGVLPSSGSETGGYSVVISGSDLSAGTTGDVNSVTFGGIAQQVLAVNGSGEITVQLGPGPVGPVDVQIDSTLCGITLATNAFTFTGTRLAVLGTNGTEIASGATPAEGNGTIFPNIGGANAITNIFAITNNGIGASTVSDIFFTGSNASSFSASPTDFVLEEGAVTNLYVVYQPTVGGMLSASLVIENDATGPLSNYVVNLSGSAWGVSPNVGSEEGGATVTVTNGIDMGNGDITEVLVDGTSCSPTAQGNNWVTFVIPAHAQGVVDIVVQSSSIGATPLVNAYSYIASPAIFGSTFTWTELPGLPQALYKHTAFVLNDALYVAGGEDSSYQSVTNVYRYDGYRWHDAVGLPDARMEGMGAVLGDRFYYIGGAFTNTAVTNVFCFDGTNWTETAGLPNAVRSGVAGVIDDQIAVAGGWDASDTYLTNTYLFNGTNWTESVGLRSARSEQGGGVRQNKLYAFGGRNSSSAATFNQYSFDGTAWSTEAGLPALLFGMGAATLNSRVYSLGGSDGSAVQDMVYRYDGINWETVGSLYTNLYRPATVRWRGALYVLGGMDMSVPLHTNAYQLTDGGVSPISGYPAGGYDVTLSGTNLCNGTVEDIISVTLCGTTAEVVNASITQIVVTAGYGNTGTGDVVIESLTYGTITAENAFTYLRGAITLIGTNGMDIAESDPASTVNGTDFGAMQVGNALTNTFGIRNTGIAPLTLTSIDGAGDGGDSFTVTVFPTNELLPGATGQITVVCASQGGEQLGQLAFRDNVNVVPFTPEMGGYTVSVFNVRSYGNGPGLGISETSLTFNTTYGVDPAAQILDVSNVGTDPLTFSNTTAYATIGDSWLSLTPAGSQPLVASGTTSLTNTINVAGVNAGTHTATISVWSATATNSPQQVRVTLVVTQASQSITWTNPGTQTYSNETPLEASASSGLTPTYTLVSGPAVLHTDSYPFYASYTNTGTVTIEVDQAGNLNYGSAATVTQTWEVIGAPAGVTLTNLVQEYDGTPKTATCITSPTGLVYNITYDGSSNAPSEVGTYEVIAIIDEQFFYGGATNTLEITKASQTITFPALGGWPTNGTVGLSATGGASGNPVTFGVLSGPGTITGLTNLAFTAIGDVYVTADQAGSDNYNPAPTVTNRVHVFSVTPDNGPYAGGNTITITNGHFGTITNAIIGIVRANDYSPLPSSVSITMPPATNAGLTDITLQTVEYGDILLHDAYTYNPQGRIAPAVYEEYRVEFRSSISTEYPSYTSPDGTYTWTQIARDGDWKELQTTNGAAGSVYLKPFGFSSGTGNGWSASGYDWIAADPADSFIYLNSSSIHTNYVVITNLQGSSYRVDVVNAYQSDGYINSDTLHPGIYQPGDPADNANYGNWPSGGNTNAGLNLNPYDTYTSQSNYVTWADATPSNGALSVVLFKTDSTANFLNCMRISGYSGMTPATPSSGSWTGGYPVVIAGENINDGSDITNVTLCGVQATIVSQALGQVWVVAGASSSGSSGDIVVQSVSYGTTIGSNLFTYTGAGLTVLGTNGQEVANGEDASRAKGTLFPPSQVGVIQTNTFSITNSGTEMLTIDPTDLSDQTDDTPFTVTGLPATLSAGAVSNISVTFSPTNIGSFGVSLAITNNSPSAVFTLNLGGSAYQMSTNVGPWSGGNTIILTNGLIGSGSDITNITVGGYEATVGAQGSNWVQITLGSGSTNGGAGDIVIQSTSVGESTFANAYTYNPAGVIAGSSVTQAYVVGTGALTNAAGSSGYGPIMFYYYSSHYQFLYTATNFADAGLTGPAKIVGLGFDVVTSTDGKALPSFLVRMKHTYMNDMSLGMDGSDLTVCYSNVGYIATAGGFDMLTFDTPFEWDGSSNVIVDTAFARASTWCNCGQTTYDAIDSRGSAYRTDAVDSSYDFDNGSTISVLPRIRVLTETATAAIEPSSGSYTGGYQVVISGNNLCDGTDMTNVTICGVPVSSIDDQTATQIMVTVDATVTPGIGDVRLYSVSYGETVGSNAFTYTGAGIQLEAPAFNPTLLGTMATNIFTVTNTGTESLLITGVTNIGTGGEYFDLSAMPSTVEAGTASNFPVIFNAAALGSYSPTCRIANNSPAGTNTFDLYGSVYDISTNSGPWSGGNTIIITNGNLGTITNILVRANDFPPLQSGPNWVALTLPPSTNAGSTDIILQTTEYGDILFEDAYTYNPQGVIEGGGAPDWDHWQEVAGLPAPQRLLAATTYDGAIYALGGLSGETNVVRFDGNEWTAVAGIPEGQYYLGAATLGSNLYVIGGESATNVYAFDGSVWTGVNGLPAERGRQGICVLSNRIYAIGGYDSDPKTNVYAFDGTHWQEVAGLPEGRYELTASTLNDHAYAIGGIGTNSVYCFDGQDWTTVATLPAIRGSLASAVLDEKIYAIGGADLYGQYTNVYRFNGSSWTEIPGLPAALRGLAAAELNGAIYAIGGQVGITAQTNVYRYPGIGIGIGVFPTSGFWTGSYPVVISGSNLCNGGMDDIISVTLAGVTATVDSVNGSTQLVVTAGISPHSVGDVVVHSTSYGTTIKSNAFTYLEPIMTALGTNGAAIASGDAASAANGTYFGALIVGQGALTNTFSITNSGNIALNISHIYSNGVGYQSYVVRDCPASVAIGAVETFSVVFEPLAGGALPAQFEFHHDGTNSPYLFNVSGAGKGGGIALATNALHFETHYDGGNPAAQFVAMDNVGISAFTYTNFQAYSPGASDWISITPADGTVGLGGSTTLTNTVDILGVNAGSHTCNIQIVADDATNSPQTVRATLVVAPATQTISFAQIPDQIITDTYGLSATGGASTNPVTFSVLSGPASIAGGTNLSFSNVGEVEVVANQAGDINYLAAQTVTNTFMVSPTKPEISTPTVSNILAQTAAIGATIDSTNGAPVTQRGVLWRVDGSTNIYLSAELGSFGTGAFSMNVTGIIAGVTNYYQVFARNVSGTVYTAENSFLARPDAPELTGATNIQADAFYANWNAAIGATNYCIDVSETNDFSSYVPGYENLVLGDANSVNVTGLGAVVYYYYRVRAQNDAGLSTNSGVWEVGLMMDLVIKALPAEHDTPAPLGYGTNRVIVNTMVTNSVTTPAEESNGVRYACTGWSGTGDVPATGTANTVTFLFSVDSTLTWHWKTQYELTQSASGGTIDGLVDGWKDEGWIFDLVPIANDGYVFKRWRTNGVNAGSTKLLTIVADSPVAVEAVFTATSWDVDTQGTVTMTGYRLDTGSGLFYCTFRVCNPSGSSTVLRDRFLYAMDPDPVTYLNDPDGTSPTGKEYKDVTAEVKSKLQSVGNGDQVMDPGECVTLNEIPFWARNPETISSYFYSRGEPEIADRDTDGDGIPNSWEDQEGLNKNNPVDGGEDQDDDGVISEQEYGADTNPFDANSFLHIYSITPDLINGEEIGWIGGTSVVQDLEWAPTLTGTWTRIQRFNPPTPTTNDWSNDPAQSPGFYRIKAVR